MERTIDKIYIRNRWVRDLAKRAEKQGFRVSVTRSNHVLFRSPDGENTAACGQTDELRHRKNILADLRRLGFTLED